MHTRAAASSALSFVRQLWDCRSSCTPKAKWRRCDSSSLKRGSRAKLWIWLWA
jgi:hypothetical protein